MKRWRDRSAWIARTVLLAAGFYVFSGMLIGMMAFGGGSTSPAETVAVEIAAGVIAIVAVTLMRVHQLTLGDVNWEYEEWTLRRPRLAIAVTAVATAIVLWSITRSPAGGPTGALTGIPAGLLAGAFFGWTNIRRTRKQRGLAPSGFTEPDVPRMESRLDHWRLRHPAVSIALFVVAFVAVFSVLGSHLAAVPVEVVVGLATGWISLRHSRVRHGVVAPPGSESHGAPASPLR